MNYQKLMEQAMQQQQQQQQQQNMGGHPLAGLDLNAATDITCDNCGSMKFHITFLLKRVSSLVSPTGEELTIPIQTFSCQSCDWINRDFVEVGTNANEPSK